MRIAHALTQRPVRIESSVTWLPADNLTLSDHRVGAQHKLVVIKEARLALFQAMQPQW